MYPTGCSAPKFYGFKDPQAGHPPQAYNVQQRIDHLWSGQDAHQNAKSTG